MSKKQCRASQYLAGPQNESQAPSLTRPSVIYKDWMTGRQNQKYYLEKKSPKKYPRATDEVTTVSKQQAWNKIHLKEKNNRLKNIWKLLWTYFLIQCLLVFLCLATLTFCRKAKDWFVFMIPDIVNALRCLMQVRTKLRSQPKRGSEKFGGFLLYFSFWPNMQKKPSSKTWIYLSFLRFLNFSESQRSVDSKRATWCTSSFQFELLATICPAEFSMFI